MTSRLLRAMRLYGSCLLFALYPVAAGAESQTPSNAPAAAPPPLPQRALEFERAGDRLKAAATYEQIVARDPAKRLILANRLVKLYAEAGATNKALTWAHQAIQNNPDPQAYMAGVYAMLGDHAEARRILEAEIAAAKEPHRALLLRWQLADSLEKAGRSDEARKVLAAAAASAAGTPDEAAATTRLQRSVKSAAPPITEPHP